MTSLWVAYLIIGLIVLVIGALLYFPGMYIARRMVDKQESAIQENPSLGLEENPKSKAGMNVTMAGVLYFMGGVALLLGCFIYGAFSPNTELGELEKTRSGRNVIALAVGVVFIILGKILDLLGIKLLVKKETGPTDS